MILQLKKNKQTVRKRDAEKVRKEQKSQQREAGKEQRQSWIWERSGELASEGDTGCGDTVLSPGTRKQSCHSSLKT